MSENPYSHWPSQPADRSGGAPEAGDLSTSAGVHCTHCGYDLTGVAIGGRCPECGTPVRQSLGVGRSDQTSTTAIVALVMGILSLTVCGLLGIVAIVLYFQVQTEHRRGRCNDTSPTMANVGLVLGVIGTALTCLVLPLFLGLMA